MDTFMDKIAQKFNAQEMIKANSEAEERELERLRRQLAEYDRRIIEIKELNQKNQEISDALQTMMESGKNIDAQMLDQVHKECVKVYRNVEAVTNEGFKQQQTTVAEQTTYIKKRTGGLKPMMMIALVMLAMILAVNVCDILGVFELFL